VAEHFGLHPNVARHHLDKLAAGGYLEVAGRQARLGAGRPSKRYRASGERLSLDAPVRADDLVLTLLGRALALLPRAEAEAHGRGGGRGVRPRPGRRDDRPHRRTATAPAFTAPSARRSTPVADALTAHGFAAHTDSRNNELRIINNHCPFGEVAMEHPVICAVDRGMVKGMLSALYGETEPAITTSLPRGDDMCVTSF
jgi:predicted ArsR family transcriptional regulator